MPTSFQGPSRWAIFLCASIVSACGGLGGGSSAVLLPQGGVQGDPLAAVGTVQIKTLSNRADLISDGNADLEIVLPPNASSSDLKKDVNGKDVTASFAARANGRVLGIVAGLPEGPSVVSAKLAGAGNAASGLLDFTEGPGGKPLPTSPVSTAL